MGRYSPNLHILVTIILSTKAPLTGKYISQAAEHLHQHLILLCKYRQLVEEVEVMEVKHPVIVRLAEAVARLLFQKLFWKQVHHIQ